MLRWVEETYRCENVLNMSANLEVFELNYKHLSIPFEQRQTHNSNFTKLFTIANPKSPKQQQQQGFCERYPIN